MCRRSLRWVDREAPTLVTWAVVDVRVHNVGHRRHCYHWASLGFKHAKFLFFSHFPSEFSFSTEFLLANEDGGTFMRRPLPVHRFRCFESGTQRLRVSGGHGKGLIQLRVRPTSQLAVAVALLKVGTLCLCFSNENIINQHGGLGIILRNASHHCGHLFQQLLPLPLFPSPRLSTTSDFPLFLHVSL